MMERKYNPISSVLQFVGEAVDRQPFVLPLMICNQERQVVFRDEYR
jgi:hypothetical protein